MLPLSFSTATLVGAVLSSYAMLIGLTLSARSWKARRNPMYLAYVVATAGWLIYLMGSSAGAMLQNQPLVFFLSHAACQIAIVGVSFFFLISASVIRFEIHSVWMAQFGVGLLLLLWNGWGPWLQDLAYTLWVVLNLLCISVLCLFGAREVERSDKQHRRWMALCGSLLGLGICIADVLTVDKPAPGNTPVHYLYAAVLLALWPIISAQAPQMSASLEGTGDPHTTAWGAVTGFGPPTDNIALAVANERRRIARDLHDGVCSQLVNILATLDTHAPQQQIVALSLEQCLMDMKIMVDVIDGADESLIDVLGRLRYRVQRALDTLGIGMHWVVDVDGPLQNLHGETARQVLRITQECLSNVMRHSHASMVEVICSYLPASNFMLLEVRDDGDGIPRREAGRLGGKGLENMQQRATSLGGHLQIFTKPGAGTRVRLLVPLPALKGPLLTAASGKKMGVDG